MEYGDNFILLYKFFASRDRPFLEVHVLDTEIINTASLDFTVCTLSVRMTRGCKYDIIG